MGLFLREADTATRHEVRIVLLQVLRRGLGVEDSMRSLLVIALSVLALSQTTFAASKLSTRESASLAALKASDPHDKGSSKAPCPFAKEGNAGDPAPIVAATQASGHKVVPSAAKDVAN